MFGKKKQNKEEEKLDFQTKNYQMNDTYKTENLVVGNLQYISSKYTGGSGPKVETTKQKYIFEKIEVDDNIRYREVFTGFIADTDSNYFDLPYVINIKPLKDVIKTVAEIIPKYGLLLAIDEINKMENIKPKVMTKKRRRH